MRMERAMTVERKDDGRSIAFCRNDGACWLPRVRFILIFCMELQV